MEEKELVICDSDVLIEVIDRNNKKVLDFLIKLGTENLCISSVTYSEIIFGALSKLHYLKLLPELEKFTLISIDTQIDKLHRDLVQRYSLTHKLSVQDALIAATALYFDIPLYSLNKKDFRFIEGLRLIP